MTFPIVPVSDIVIVEQLTQDTSAGGIILTGDARKFPCGVVVAVGPGRVYTTFMDAAGTNVAGQLIPCSVKEGDWVIFGKYNSGGEPIEFEGKKYLMCREGDLGGKSLDGNPVQIRLSVE